MITTSHVVLKVKKKSSLFTYGGVVLKYFLKWRWRLGWCSGECFIYILLLYSLLLIVHIDFCFLKHK